MNDKDTLSKLQENLAKDLVHIEIIKSVSNDQQEEINDAYSKVYDIVTEIKALYK